MSVREQISLRFPAVPELSRHHLDRAVPHVHRILMPQAMDKPHVLLALLVMNVSNQTNLHAPVLKDIIVMET